MCSSIYIVLVCVISLVQCDYWEARRKLVQEERNMAIGAKIQLNAKENEVNHILMKYKRKELDLAFKNPATFPPAMHFFKAKKEIDKSTVYSIIKQLPKGAALHAHDMSLTHPDWIVSNVTYRDHLYACSKDGAWSLVFADPPPKDDCWKSVQLLRKQSPSNEKFDAWLKSKFTLEVDDPEVVYKDINSAWKAFMDIFSIVIPLLTYRPVFEDYMYQVLQNFYDDNVMYLEMRGILPLVYDLNGWPSNPIQVVGIMENIAKRFVADHPDFLGIKFIYAPPRHVGNDTVNEYLQLFRMMQEMYPDFMAGFDLVGQEDLGRPLVEFVNQLKEYGNDIKYFFHAGETDWNGMSTDMNLVDAVLLNATRIGHGYALIKHPRVLEEVMARNIAVEVNPISNQVLMLVQDLRNHPASILLALNYPVVISSDDPGFWGADALSHDFYMAFMGMASAEADLKMLKQLAINSIQYSVLSKEQKVQAMNMWEKKWNSFLDELINQYKNISLELINKV